MHRRLVNSEASCINSIWWTRSSMTTTSLLTSYLKRKRKQRNPLLTHFIDKNAVSLPYWSARLYSVNGCATPPSCHWICYIAILNPPRERDSWSFGRLYPPPHRLTPALASLCSDQSQLNLSFTRRVGYQQIRAYCPSRSLSNPSTSTSLAITLCCSRSLTRKT